MNLSFKEKLDLIKSLKYEKINLLEIDKYIDYLNHRSLVEPVFKKLIYCLIDLDVYIYSIYDSIDENDWLDIVSEYETPIESPLYGEIREKIKNFINAYTLLEKSIDKINVNVLLNLLSIIPLNKTCSMQFLFFKLASYKPKSVLFFLLDQVKSNPIVYIPYFVSFVARCDIDSGSVIKEYIRYVEGLKKNTGLLYVLASQGLIYLCCFKRCLLVDCKEIINYVFENKIYSYMNPHVVEVFCSIFNYQYKIFRSIDHFSLYHFPFDKSILDKIHELYAERYIEFNSEK